MIETLMLIVLGYAVGVAVIVAQMVVLARIMPSWAWWFITVGFVIMGTRTIWQFIMVPAAIVKAMGRNELPVSLPVELWILLGSAYVMVAAFIAGLDQLRQNLREIGVK